ncbi:MAG: YchJ family protein [Bdellovibrionota bacterium]
MSKCYCGSGQDYATCCEPYIKGTSKAPTPEALMRSRYCAFVTADVDYIEKTTDPSAREGFDRDGTMEWAKNSEWKGLEIVSTEGGGKTDTTGQVEFIANYKYDGADRAHHERSEFKKREGSWFFLDGKLVQAPVRNENKIGRNDPCHCGSGKKFKKCHGT